MDITQKRNKLRKKYGFNPRKGENSHIMVRGVIEGMCRDLNLSADRSIPAKHLLLQWDQWQPQVTIGSHPSAANVSNLFEHIINKNKGELMNNLATINNELIFGDHKYPVIKDHTYNLPTIPSGIQATIDGVIEVQWEDLDIEGRSAQTRVEDIDEEHVNKLKNDIKARGRLFDPPVVEWDALSEKFVVVSGHHRLFAMQKLEWDSFPVAAATFPTPWDREEFCQEENNRPPQKNHDQKDAVLYIRKANKHKRFDRFNGNKEEIKKECYRLLKKRYASMSRGKHTKVIDESFSWNIDRTKRPTALERKQVINKHMKDVALKEIDYQKKTCVWSTDYSNLQKVYGTMRGKICWEKQRRLDDGEPAIGGPILTHAVVYFNSGTSKAELQQMRKDVRSYYTSMNKFENSDIALMYELTFMPQVVEPARDKETEEIRFRWCYDLEQFKLVEE